MTPTEFKAARVKLGMTQQALADHLGRDISALQRWEANSARRSSIAPPLWAAREIKHMLKEQANEQQ